MYLSWPKISITCIQDSSLQGFICVYKWPNSIKVNCSNVASHLSSPPTADLKNSGFAQGGKSARVIFSLTCQAVCRLVLMGFPGLCIPGSTATVHSKPGLALPLAAGASYVPCPTRLLSLCCSGCVGVSWVLQCCGWTGIPSCSKGDLGLGLLVTLAMSDCYCNALLWPTWAPLVPSCWLVHKKLGCCCLPNIVFWILLQSKQTRV